MPLFCLTANGWKDGRAWSRRNWRITVPLTLLTYTVSFYAWHRLAGYNNEAYLEQNYAKNSKMLRNLIIK
jgi:hypothetical protein